MCLAAVSLAPNSRRPLTIVANRDEFHARPTAVLRWWRDGGEPIAAGRDLRDGGTWLGVNRRCRWGLVLNRPPPGGDAERSRGELITAWLNDDCGAEEFLTRLQAEMAHYRPFNLVLGEGAAAASLSSPSGEICRYGPGLHLFSNCEPGTATARTERLRTSFEPLLAEGVEGQDLLLPLSPVAGAGEGSAFILSPDYGTGCSTVLEMDSDGRVRVLERRWTPAGAPAGDTELDFVASAAPSATAERAQSSL